MAKNAKEFAEAARKLHQDGATLQAEVNAVLQKLAAEDAYASRFYDAVDADDRKEVISLLRAGGIKQARIGSLELFPGNLKVTVTFDLNKMTITVEIET